MENVHESSLPIIPRQPEITRLVFAVMGVTGAGKSTFIKTLTDISNIPIGHDLESCTNTVNSYTVRYSPTFEVTFLDTPGFDDGALSEYQILTTLAAFLAKEYRSGTTLNGIIYAHAITTDKMTGSARKSLRLFKKLCGEEAFRSVLLMTTKWGLLTDHEKGERFEQELRQKHWGDMIERGARTVRWDDTLQGALQILNMFQSLQEGNNIEAYPQSEAGAAGVAHIRAHLPPPVVLNIQKEIVEEQLQVVETAAGMLVVSDLSDEAELQITDREDVLEELSEASDNRYSERDIEYLMRREREISTHVAQLITAKREINNIDITEMAAGLMLGAVTVVGVMTAGWYTINNPGTVIGWLGKVATELGASGVVINKGMRGIRPGSSSGDRD